MTWTEIALLTTAGATLLTCLVTAPLTLLRACQAYRLVQEIRAHQLKEK